MSLFHSLRLTVTILLRSYACPRAPLATAEGLASPAGPALLAAAAQHGPGLGRRGGEGEALLGQTNMYLYIYIYI